MAVRPVANFRHGHATAAAELWKPRNVLAVLRALARSARTFRSCGFLYGAADVAARYDVACDNVIGMLEIGWWVGSVPCPNSRRNLTYSTSGNNTGHTCSITGSSNIPTCSISGGSDVPTCSISGSSGDPTCSITGSSGDVTCSIPIMF